MNTAVTRAAKLAQSIGKMGQLCLPKDEDAREVVTMFFRVLEGGEPRILQIPHCVLVLQLILIGIAATYPGAIIKPELLQENVRFRGRPVTLEVRARFELFRRLIYGADFEDEGGFEVNDLRRMQALAEGGLVACRLAAPLSKRFKRRPDKLGVERIKWRIAYGFRKFRSGNLTLTRIIEDLAKEDFLEAKKTRLLAAGNLAEGVIIDEEDAYEVSQLQHRIDNAYRRWPPINDDEVRDIRRFIAMLMRAKRRLPPEELVTNRL